MNFLTKAELYNKVNTKAEELGLNLSATNYRIDAISLAKKVCLNLHIELINFEETKICGILYKGRNTTTIGLNARRSFYGRNFDCMHELIHYFFHDHIWTQCTQNLNDHMEWQANEGAAQLLMPYQSFIPNYIYYHDLFYNRLSPNHAAKAQITQLARHYKVGSRAAEYRINGLKKEIAQYLNGIPIQNIKIISANKSQSF